MSEAVIEPAGAGRFVVRGPLTFETVTGVLRASEGLFANSGEPMRIDLSGVTESDSAGVALLVEWLSRAAAKQRPITFHNAPESLLAIARISEVDKLLPLAA